MEMHSATNGALIVWVDRVEEAGYGTGRLIIDVIDFDENCGFGTQKRGFAEGDFICLASHHRAVVHGMLGLLHSPRDGWHHYLQGFVTGSLPPPPFLLCDRDRVQQIFDGEVAIDEEDEVPTPYDIGDDGAMAVVTKTWFGILYRKPAGGPSHNRLVAFSFDRNATVKVGDLVEQPVLEKTVGTIREVGESISR